MSKKNVLVLNRNHVLSTKMGHTVAFEKGKNTFVPPAAYAEAIAIGAMPADGSDPNVLEETATGSKAPADPAQRGPLILTAIEQLVATNERKDFTAAGTPSVKAIERVLGFDVDGREVAAAWQEHNEKKAAQ